MYIIIIMYTEIDTHIGDIESYGGIIIIRCVSLWYDFTRI